MHCRENDGKGGESFAPAFRTIKGDRSCQPAAIKGKEDKVTALLRFSGGIDAFSKSIGTLCEYAVLICCLISAANASIRYVFSYSSNAWLEIQWYLFAFIVMMGASHTLRMKIGRASCRERV